MTPLTIIGMGSRLCGDDAIGLAILDALQEEAGSDLELIEGGLDALAALESMAGRDQVILVDATRMGLDPGSVRAFMADQVNLQVREDHLSLHGIGLSEALEMGERLGLLPSNLKIIGIQPLSINVGTGLSEPVQAAIPEVLDLIRTERQLQHHMTDAYRGTGGIATA